MSPCMRFLTFFTVSAGWLAASLMSVDKKFLHFLTFSIKLLLFTGMAPGGVAAAVCAAETATGLTPGGQKQHQVIRHVKNEIHFMRNLHLTGLDYTLMNLHEEFYT